MAAPAQSPVSVNDMMAWFRMSWDRNNRKHTELQTKLVMKTEKRNLYSQLKSGETFFL